MMETEPTAKDARSIPLTALFTIGAWGLLAGVVALVGSSAAPAVARSMGLTEVRVVARDFPRSAPVGQAGVDAVRDFERDIGASIDRLDRRGGHLEEADEMKLVFTRKAVPLRESPTSRAVVGTIPANTAVVIVMRQGAWLQVVHQGTGDALESGWIEVRDLDLP